MRYTSLFALIAVLAASSCSGDESFDQAAYEKEILEWRQGRLERLLAPQGFLSLAGRFWLDLPLTTFGSGAGSDLHLPDTAASAVGVFEISDAGVTMRVSEGVEVLHDGETVTTLLMHDGAESAPVVARHENLAWTVIKRDDRYAMRLWDVDHPALKDFPPFEYFPIDPTYRVEATLRRYEEPRIVQVNTVIEGLDWNPVSPGIAEFEINGELQQIEAYDSDDELFFVFGDRTSGRETYGAGRFLYAPAPGEDGRFVLDFNRSYTPPCGFTDFATCPVASMRNRMKVGIEAGELYDEDAYSAYVGHH
jgi:uncharacterized protein (DUF1684 family)